MIAFAFNFSGSGAVWQRASLGDWRPRVQIPAPRPQSSMVHFDWILSISIENWSTLALVLILGAMTPGPSLVLVIRNTIFGGRWYGITTGIGHGIGFSIYAFAAATGIAVVVLSLIHI